MSAQQAEIELAEFKQLFPVEHDTPLVFTQWEQLVTQYQVFGRNALDSRHVAAMRVHGIQQLLTFNTQDFTRYLGITVLSPADVLKATSPATPSQSP